MKQVKTKVQMVKHFYCPECLTGDSDSEFMLFCLGCGKLIDNEKEDIICLKKYSHGNSYSHYHKKCFEKSEVSLRVLEGVFVNVTTIEFKELKKHIENRFFPSDNVEVEKITSITVRDQYIEVRWEQKGVSK